MKPDQLEIIKERYKYAEAEAFQGTIGQLIRDVKYLVNRVEVAEKTARRLAVMSGQFTTKGGEEHDE